MLLSVSLVTPGVIPIVCHTGGILDLVFCVSAYLWLLVSRSPELSLLLSVPQIYCLLLHLYLRLLHIISVLFDISLYSLVAVIPLPRNTPFN